MPLTGVAKREYMREYMRTRRPRGRAVVAAVKDALGVRGRGRPAQLPSEAVVEGQGVLRAVLRETGLDLQKIARKVDGQFEAQRPYGKDAIEAADNDAQLRACELAIKLHERAGTIPSVGTSTPPQTGRVRMIQVAPDGTRTLIEVEG